MYRTPSVPAQLVVESLERRTFLAAVALRDGLTAHLWSGSVSYNGGTYFQGNDAAHGFELWRTDGTAAGTRLVKDINPTVIGSQAYHSFPESFMVFNGALLFIARDSNNGPHGLWRTDGTAAGTIKLTDAVIPNLGLGKEGWYVFRGKLYGLSPEGLVATDGTVAGTHLVVSSSDSSSLAGTNDRLFWLSEDRHSVMSYDGAAVTTVAAAPAGAEDPVLRSSFGDGVVYHYRVFESTWTTHDVVLAPRERVVRPLREQQRNYDGHDDLIFNGVTYFADNDDGLRRRRRLPAQDVLLHGHIEPGSLTVARGALYFADGPQLWRTDGTTTGTRLVRDFGATGRPNDLVGTRTHLFFTLYEPDNTVQPWRTDGSPEGTVALDVVGPHAPPSRSVFGIGDTGAGLLVGVRDQLYLIPGARSLRATRSDYQALRFGATDARRTPHLFGTRPIDRDDVPSDELL